MARWLVSIGMLVSLGWILQLAVHFTMRMLATGTEIIR